jgi:hypothetical protein
MEKTMRRIILAFALAGVLSVPTKADETLQYRHIIHVTSLQSLDLRDIDGHTALLARFSGTAIFADNSIAATEGSTFADLVKGNGSLNGYTTLNFNDGSSLVYKWSGTSTADGKGAIQKGSGIITGGKGRYEGAKGDFTWAGGRAGPAGTVDSYADFVVNIKK